jgi:hypothetical protein
MKKLKVLLSVISMLTIGAANASTLVLDSFNYVPALDLEVTSIAPAVDSDSVISAESGATADYTLTFVSGSGTDSVDANLWTPGLLNYNEDSGADGELLIEYSIVNPATSNTLDFTGYDGFYFDIVTLDGGDFDIEITLKDLQGDTISATYTIGVSGIFNAWFSAMTASPGYAMFDFDKVLTASTNITSAGNADDFSLSSVGLVPEPSALAILGLGLIGLGLRRRKLV